jgi:repressor LexA
MEKLTKKQKKILDYITEFIKLNDYAPSYQEIADYFGLVSKATVFEHIRSLEDKGYLRVAQGVARSIEISSFYPKKPALELPLAGLITAGEPIEAIEQNETITVPAELIKDEANSYVLKVKGESMIDEGILDGDFVVVERNYYPKNGDVVVALLDNTYATLKKYFREKKRIRLQPANSAMKPIFVKNPAIQGVVKGIFRVFGRV